ncbi:MAG: glutaredoxin family protein [Candidatus Sulfotelmatobacter sp.]|jgi:arsenate reductase-like glutaredoxin family protein
MMPRIFLFTQPNCLSCEVVKIFLEVREIAFEQRDITLDPLARAEFIELYHGSSAPAVVILMPTGPELIEGFDPDRIDHFLSAA